MERLIIIGAGMHAQTINETTQDNNKKTIAFLDPYKKGHINNIPINKTKSKNKYDTAIIALGAKLIKKRKQIINKLTKQKTRFTTIKHKTTTISKTAKIGKGTAILANTTINNNAKIGKHCTINTGSIIEHDTKIGNNTFIQPNATICGNTKIGNNTIIGAGATILENLKIGNNAIIGAGAVVTKNIPNNTTAKGIPAKTKKNK